MKSKYQKTKNNYFRKSIGNLADRFTYQIVASGTTIFAIINRPYPANAQIFDLAREAMGCIVSSSKTGTNNALLTNLPTIIFFALTLVIFGYFLYTVGTAISSYGKGEEITHVIQQPLFTFIFVVLIFVFQNLMFGSSVSCSSTGGAAGGKK